MTMPHLMNCDHSDEGWCLDCVKQMHDELERERDEARTAAKTLYVNMPPPSISGNIIYDAPRRWSWIKEAIEMRVVTPPDNSRNVRCFLADGTMVIGFYWAVEKLWYAEEGGKRKKDAINVVDWRELEERTNDRHSV